jgi:hypothetical protein
MRYDSLPAGVRQKVVKIKIDRQFWREPFRLSGHTRGASIMARGNLVDLLAYTWHRFGGNLGCSIELRRSNTNSIQLLLFNTMSRSLERSMH